MRYLQLFRLLVLLPFLSMASDVELREIDENGSDQSTGSYASAGSDLENSESSQGSDKTSSASTLSSIPPTPLPPSPVSNRDPTHDNDEILTHPSQRVNNHPPTFNSDNVPQRWRTLARPAKVYIVCQALMELVPPALVGVSYNGDETVALAALVAEWALMGGRLVYGCVLNHPHEGWFKKCFRHTVLQSFAAFSALATWDYYNFIQEPGAHPQSFGWGGSFGTTLFSMLVFFTYANNQ